MFQGFQKSEPIWMSLKVEVYSLLSALWDPISDKVRTRKQLKEKDTFVVCTRSLTRPRLPPGIFTKAPQCLTCNWARRRTVNSWFELSRTLPFLFLINLNLNIWIWINGKKWRRVSMFWVLFVILSNGLYSWGFAWGCFISY